MISTSKRRIRISGSVHDVLLLSNRDDESFIIEYDGVPFEIFLGESRAKNCVAFVDGIPHKIEEMRGGNGTLSLLVNNKKIQVSFSNGDVLYPPLYARQDTVNPKRLLAGRDSGRVIANMPGRIVSIKVRPADRVKAGDPLFVLLAMKMENTIVAPSTGIVRELHVGVGVTVNKGDLLAVIG